MEVMRSRIVAFLKNPTSSQIVTNTLGNYLNVAFTALFAVLLVRIIEPDQYGILSVLLGISYVFANVLEFGTTATIYSTLPNLDSTDRAPLYRFIKSTLFFQSALSIGVLIIFAALLPQLDLVFFKTGAPLIDLYLTALSILFFIWQNFLTNILFAAKRFLRANIYINLANFIKMIALFAMVTTGNTSVGMVIAIFGIVGPLSFFLMMFSRNISLSREFWKAPVKKEEFRFGYTMTYFLASQFYNLGIRMDLFLLSFFGMGLQVGYYGLAQKIILTVLATVISVSQVLSPQFSSVKTYEDKISLLKKGLLYMTLPFMVFIALILTPPELFTLVFTSKYHEAILVTRYLSAAFALISYGTIFTLFLLYTVKKPQLILRSNIILFLGITFGSYFLIPRYGMYGPPIAIFGAFIFAIGMQGLAVWKEIGWHSEFGTIEKKGNNPAG